jgi:dihydroflavonol-4-reductase
VDDVVAGLVAAGERGVPGATYVLSGEQASFNDVALRVAELAGVRPPPLRMPTGVAVAAGTVLDALARVTKLRFPISVEAVRSGTRDRWLHGHERATRELDWHPRPLAEGLPETVAWLKTR